jgi:methionine-rich copper-binding protein CopC
MPPLSRRATLLGTVAVAVAALLAPAHASAHAELVSSQPANGATVAAGFTGPIVLTYDEALAQGSHAELLNPSGQKVLDAAIDTANRARMVFTPATPLEPGAWTIQWTSIGADRDIARSQLRFTVAAPTAPPTAPPTLAPTAVPTAAPTATAGPSPTPQPSPSPTASPTPTPTSTFDVVLPIVAALALVGVAAYALLRRRGGPV